jgi:hypothetical protein
MNDVHEVIEALGKVVTTALLPVLTEMGDWFGSVGPQAVGILRTVMAGLGVIFGTLVDAGSALLSGLGGALKAIGAAVLAIFGQDSAPVGAMEFFKNVLRTIEVAFILARVVIEAAVEVLMTVIDTLAGELQRLGSVSQAALNALAGDGKWSEVTAAWSKGTQAIEDKTSEHNTKLLAIAKKGMADVNAALLDDIGHAAVDKPTAAPKAGDTSDTGDENKQRLLAKLAAELEAKKAAWATEQAANGSFLQFSLEQEREFWESKRSVVTAGSTDALAVEHNISKLTVQIKKDEYKETLADLKTAEAQFKSNLEAKLAIAQQLAAKIAAAEGTRSTAAQTAAAAVTSIERELAAQRLAINESYIKAASVLELSKIDAAEREAQLENSLGSTTAAQLLAQEKGFEDQRFQLKVQALQRDLALASQDPDKNPAKIATLNQQIIAAQTQHDAQMDKLRIKGTLEANKEWGAVFTSMRSGFATTISDFLKGTTSIGGAIKGLFQDIGNSILQMVSNLAAQYLETSLMQVLTSKTSGAAIIGTLAAQAAAGAFAATAAIPYVGPELAPAAAALAYSDTMAFQAVAAASGGFDIPANVNPLVQTHAEEMILPPPLANAIRDMVTQGGAGGGHTFNVTTLDGASLVKYLNQNGNSVSQALRRLNSRFM